MTGANRGSSQRDNPDWTQNAERTRKGKVEGRSVPRQKVSPCRAPWADASGKQISNTAASTANDKRNSPRFLDGRDGAGEGLTDSIAVPFL